jgi:hypothetical protein
MTSTLDEFCKGMHSYLRQNYDLLYKQFIFYYDNVHENHWIVHIAINPFAVLDRVLYPKEDLQFEYGY